MATHDWARGDPDRKWIEEYGNHFLRSTSPSLGKMVMLDQEIPVPAGVEAIELS